MTDKAILYEGTEDYMAPEVLSGQEFDQRSDVYSLGKLIAFLYSQGSMPYEYKQVVKKATAENPEKRFKSVEEMRKAIAKNRYTRNSLFWFGVTVVVSLMAIYLYMDSLPEPSNNFEFQEHPTQSAHIIDSVDMLWDRTIIMQGGQIKANVTRAEVDEIGKSLEDLFFEVTEGIDESAVKSEGEPSV